MRCLNRTWLVVSALLVALAVCGTPHELSAAPGELTLPGDTPDFLQEDPRPGWGWRIGAGRRPFFKSNRLRFGQAGLVKRAAIDLVAMPLNIAWWDGRDWALAFLVTSAAAGFMVPGSPSADVQIQATIGANQHPALNNAFPHISTAELGIGVGAYIASAALVGWLWNDGSTQEYASLMTEALLVTHAYHISGKLLTGREPPDKNSGQGTVHGPERGSDIFPSGTPSGHAATVCTMAAVTLEHYRSRPIDVASVLACAYMSGSVLYNDQHFASDVIWGAAMGWFIGQWVARHRSKRGGRSHPQSLAQSHDVFILPFGTDIESGIGVSLLVPFH